jgi:ankyrin repeat protein
LADRGGGFHLQGNGIAWKNHKILIQRLLGKGTDIDARDQYGRIALGRQAANRNVAMVRLLLEEGADIDTKDESGRTLHSQAMHGKVAAVRQLLEEGADIEAKDLYANTALHKTVEWDRQEAAGLL